MSMKIEFSFLKLYNSIKGIGAPEKPGNCDPDYLAERADKATQERFKKFYEWCKKEGIWNPKVKYPVLFGKGDAKYPGMLATEDIGANEPIIQVPGRLAISTAKAFREPALQHVWYENPEIFGKHVNLGEDKVLLAYILYHLGLGEKSEHYMMMSCWPRPNETDILMNWDEEDLEWLQDPTMLEDAEKGYDEMIEQWNQLYICLRNYPDLFPEQNIGLNKFKWIYILTTNRCFSSNWPGNSQMMPFADYINHENVDTGFDCVDDVGVSYAEHLELEDKEFAEKRRKQYDESRSSIFNMRTDLLKMEMDIRKIMEKSGNATQTAQEMLEKETDLELMQKIQNAVEQSEESKGGDDQNQDEDGPVDEAGYHSSGLSSDNDTQMLLEQEYAYNRIRKEKAKMDKDYVPTEEEKAYEEKKKKMEKPLSKDEAMKIWQMTVENIPHDYTFQIKTHKDTYPKGSQVFICYGRMTNRECLKRYGFCTTNNKYNNIFIRLQLQMTDPDFKYRYFLLQKFFNMKVQPDPSGEALSVQSRHFKIYYQKFNTKVLKFVKILNFNVQKDDIACVVESRSLSLEYLCLQKLKGIYESFLNSYPTELKEDLAMMRDKEASSKWNMRQYMSMVFRTEQKRVLVNQIKLCKILMQILERVMKGQTLEFAVLRVHEFESKMDHPINRVMLSSYLSGLEKGLKANASAYYKQRGLNDAEGQDLLMEVQRSMRYQVTKQEYRQNEIKGYETMLLRVLQDQTPKDDEHKQMLEDSLTSVTEAMKVQQEKNDKLEIEVAATLKARRHLEALESCQTAPIQTQKPMARAIEQTPANENMYDVKPKSLIDFLPKDHPARIKAEAEAAAKQKEQEEKAANQSDEGSGESYYDSEEDSDDDDAKKLAEEGKENQGLESNGQPGERGVLFQELLNQWNQVKADVKMKEEFAQLNPKQKAYANLVNQWEEVKKDINDKDSETIDRATAQQLQNIDQMLPQKDKNAGVGMQRDLTDFKAMQNVKAAVQGAESAHFDC